MRSARSRADHDGQIVGLLWTYVDRGDLGTWLEVTALAAALGIWFAALRGSDPS